MKLDARFASGASRRRRWSALGAAVGLGGVLVALLFAGFAARAAAAAGLPEPATAYPCSEVGLNAALAAGGSATFTCGAPTTVTLSTRKTVARDVTLAGGNKLILSGGNLTSVFTVAAGVRLNLLDLTFANAYNTSGDNGGAIYNNGRLTATHSLFVNNSGYFGTAVYNAPGAAAVITGSRFYGNFGAGGALANGDPLTTTAPAALLVVNSVFSNNNAIVGSAILNFNGPVTVTGSSFVQNGADYGGAIYDVSRLSVDHSQFSLNAAASFVASQARPRAPAVPVIYGGGAIGIGDTGQVLIADSAFTSNFALDTGGAIFFATLPLDSNVLAQTGSLLIVNSRFVQNCTGGSGGALASAFAATVLGSSFTQNKADANPAPCFAGAAARVSAAHAPALAVDPAFVGIGGAIYNAARLTVADTTFLSNTATLTVTQGGGGAIQNGLGSALDLRNSRLAGNTSQQDGGAIYDDYGSVVNIAGTDFSANDASQGAGGALANLGALTVTTSSFVGNHGSRSSNLFGGGGAIFSSAGPVINGPASPNGPALPPGPAPRAPVTPIVNHLTLDHVTFVSNTSEFEGGAVDAGATTILASTFQSNTAAYGGAINVFEPGFTISGSTFIANAVVDKLVDTAQQGGAIDTNNLPVSILNSTFFQNRAHGSATGGAISTDPSSVVDITNSTFLSNSADLAGSGGAFYQHGTITLRDVLVAFNGSENCDSAVTLSGANLEFPGTSCGGASVQANPRALAPANNGGPTLTSALLPGSPAINAGNNSGCPTTDQRGAPRPVGTCDLGAFEFGGLVPRLWLPLARE